MSLFEADQASPFNRERWAKPGAMRSVGWSGWFQTVDATKITVHPWTGR